MWKAMLLAGALGSLSPWPARGQAQPPDVPDADIQRACEQALAKRGIRNPSEEQRRRCAADVRARIANGQIKVTRCVRALDPNQQGWSMDAGDFARLQGIPMCR
jgi:hypothetical protein